MSYRRTLEDAIFGVLADEAGDQNWADQIADKIAPEVRRWLVGLAASDEVRETVYVAAAPAHDFTRYSADAHPDHNRWSWRGDGHDEAMRAPVREGADAAVGAFLGAAGCEVGSGSTDGLADRENGSERGYTPGEAVALFLSNLDRTDPSEEVRAVMQQIADENNLVRANRSTDKHQWMPRPRTADWREEEMGG